MKKQNPDRMSESQKCTA